MTKRNDQAVKLTLRQAFNFHKAAEELKARGSLDFRLTVAALDMEAKTHFELFNEGIKPSKGIQAYREELRIHLQNCTTEKDGKKTVDVKEYMKHYEDCQEKYARQISDAERLEDASNKMLQEKRDFYNPLIPYDLIREADAEEKFNASLLTNILPFVADKV